MPPDYEFPGFSHTPDHIGCPACEATRARILKPVEFGRLRFREAAKFWLEERRANWSATTFQINAYYVRSLSQFFAALPLEEIHVGHVKEYERTRQNHAGASLLRHEINCLGQILKRAGLWMEIARLYRLPRLPRSQRSRVLSEEEEQRLFLVASSNPRWKVAYWASLLTATTSAGPSEIRHLKLGDIDKGEKLLYILDGTKNDEDRPREVPLNDSAWFAVQQLLKRACKLGAWHVDHCLLPGRHRRGKYDPTIPMGTWKKAWKALTEKAGLHGFRMYDLRHHAATKLMENENVSEETAEELCGWSPGSKMKKHYSHIRRDKRREAVKALEVKLPPRLIENPVETSVDKSEGFVQDVAATKQNR